MTVGGDLELAAANETGFRARVSSVLDGHTCVEIDLSRTIFMDCAGLGALIALRNLMRSRRGIVRLVDPTLAVRQLLELTRTRELFEIVNAREPVA